MPRLDHPAPQPADWLALYHHGASSCSQRVRMALAEKGLAWESRITDLRVHAHRAPAYLAVDPRGLVPALIDGNAVWVESIDILRHLEARWPSLPGADDPLLDAADAAQSPLKTLTHEWMFRARLPGPPDAPAPPAPAPAADAFLADFHADGPAWRARVGADVAAMTMYLADLETRLTLAPWLGGSAFGLVDIAWGSTVERLDALGWPLSALLAGWLARLRARPSFAEAYAKWLPPGAGDAQAAYVARRAAQGTSLAHAVAPARAAA